jgi:hypothetical protein
MSHEQTTECYLGDGLYARFDGHGINLRAPRHDGDHWVYLEPEVYHSLLKFVDQLKENPQ